MTHYIGIQNDVTRIKEAEERASIQNDRLSSLRSIDIAIMASFDQKLTLEVVLKELHDQLKVDASAILLYHPQNQKLTFGLGKGFRTLAPLTASIPPKVGYASEVVRTQTLIKVNDLRHSSGEFVRHHSIAEEEFVTYIATPLITKGSVRGVLELFFRSEFNPTDDWMSFLDTIAGQAAIALDNARLFQELNRVNQDLLFAYEDTLTGWAKALDIRDQETEGHSQRVTDLTVKIATARGYSDEQIAHTRRGALLHDIGKLGIPDDILLKPDKLTEEEWKIMKMHPVYAFEWLSPISFLSLAIDIPYCHHEKWDGSGYPRGLKKEVIPESARIFAFVDVYDALASERPYRKAWAPEKIERHILDGVGSHFDPALVDLFFDTLRAHQKDSSFAHNLSLETQGACQ